MTQDISVNIAIPAGHPRLRDILEALLAGTNVVAATTSDTTRPAVVEAAGVGLSYCEPDEDEIEDEDEDEESEDESEDDEIEELPGIVRDAIRTLPDPCTKAQIYKLLSHLSATHAAIDQVVTMLVDYGEVERVGRMRYRYVADKPQAEAAEETDTQPSVDQLRELVKEAASHENVGPTLVREILESMKANKLSELQPPMRAVFHARVRRLIDEAE